jgi:hypothetical protein
MKKIFKSLSFVFLFISIVSCQKENNFIGKHPSSERGSIVRTELIAAYSKQEILDRLIDFNPLINTFVNPQYDCDLIKIVYNTIDPFGKPTIASGVVVLPKNISTAIPLAAYQHGTILKKSDAPSSFTSEVLIGLALASEGYVVSITDYLGLGDGPGIHPYVHGRSEATAVIDMLRAARIKSVENNVNLNHQLFLFGYSQGGHATMATHKLIQEEYQGEFTVTGSCPMAGPYDASGAQAEMLVSDNPYPAPYYLPYLLNSYIYVYGQNTQYSKLADVLKEPYSTTIPPLLNGFYGAGDVDAQMTQPIKNILKDNLLNSFINNPNHFMRKWLEDNDLMDWKPQGKMKIIYCSGDDHVTYLNSINAYNKFMENGASPSDITMVDVSPSANHNDCALPSILNAKSFIDALKE